MKLAPALDLKGTRVVAARLGERERYAPSATPLCRSSNPPNVVQALLALFPFDTLYIADLDAITGTGNNFETIRRLHLAYPHLTLWVDNGNFELQLLTEFARPVIGSESLDGLPEYIALRALYPTAVLSLDFRERDFIGPAALLEQHGLWPDDLIVMTLARVGSTRGPDLALLSQLSLRRPETRFYAGGGIRDRNDLKWLDRNGISGCLLATALHQGFINSGDLRDFASHSP